jgi:hypothetical protein
MTTMDVGIGGPNGSVHLANGLSGTATAVLFAASEALAADGRAEGMAGAAGCEVTMKGAVLQEILDGMPWTNLYPRGSSSEEELEGFRDSIDPDATYSVGGVEV